MSKQGKGKSRREFFRQAAQAAAGAGVAAGLAGCDPGSYLEYLAIDGADKVNDRFHESMSGYARHLEFPTATSDQFCFLWTSDIHIVPDKPCPGL